MGPQTDGRLESAGSWPRVDHLRAEYDVLQRLSPPIDHDPKQADREQHATDRP
jgi:hypothetical protein